MTAPDITIPPEALEAAARAAARAAEEQHGCEEGRKLLGFSSREEFIEAAWPNYVDQARAACLAMLKAWPGAEYVFMQPHRRAVSYSNPAIILPLTQENTNVEA